MDCEQLGHELAVEVLTLGNQPMTPARTAHLKNCTECRRVYEELRETAYFLSVLMREGGPPGLPQRTLWGSAAHPVTYRNPHLSAPSPSFALRCPLRHSRTEPSGVPRTHQP